MNQKHEYGTREFIEAARKVMQPSPVRPCKVPLWMRKRLFAAMRRMGLNAQTNANCELLTTVSPRGLLDHHGRTNWHGNDAFVTEPYDDRSELAAVFAERLGDGVEWRLDANSWHFPGRTFRIVFWEDRIK